MSQTTRSRRPLPLRRALAVFSAALVLAACDTAQAPPAATALTGDPAYDALLADVGGVDGLAALLADAPAAELRAVLAGHDIGFEEIDLDAADLGGADPDDDDARMAGDGITDCPMYFRTADRQTWIRLKGAGGSESHYIDGQGRPLSAYKRLPPATTAARQTTCQTAVGNWGSPASSYDGGHLIGSQLGGWGGRANIVPQHYNFNRGNWKRIEDGLAQCDRLASSAVEYYVTVSYPSGSSTVTPSHFTSNVSVSGSAWENASFANASGGGSDGASQASSMVSWLRGRGCL